MREKDDGWFQDLSFAEAVFVALDAIDTLSNDASTDECRSKVGFDDVYRFATQPSCAMSAELRRALQTNPRLRADFRYLLDRKMKYRSTRCAAASTGPTTVRHGSGFRITLRESRADQNQIYVIIRLDSKIGSQPKTLFVIDDQCGCQKLPLPTPSAGSVQLLVDSDSDLVTAIRNPETEIFMQ